MNKIELNPCKACGQSATESTFLAPSSSFLSKVVWTRIECRNHSYVSVSVESENRNEAALVWNDIMRE